MARRGRGVELFEVLSDRSSAKDESSKREPQSSVTPPPSTSDGRTVYNTAGAREIVFGFDSAFVLFVAVLILLGSAFYLGHQRGNEERRHGLTTLGEDGPRYQESVAVFREIDGNLNGILEVPPEMFTLQIFETSDASEKTLALLAFDRDYVLNLEEVRREGIHEARVFRKSGVYILTVGLFTSESDPALARLEEAFRRTASAPPHRGENPYNSCRRTQVRQLLGEAVL